MEASDARSQRVAQACDANQIELLEERGTPVDSPVDLKETQGRDIMLVAAALTPDDRRSEPRYETTVSGRVRLPASEHDCQIADISTGGMNVIAPEAAITIGLQVAVLSQGLPRLVGIVRWIGGGSFGVQFTKSISSDVVERIGQLKRRIRSPRAGRIETDLPAQVFFDGKEYAVTVRNISVGGLMMTTEQPFRRGQRKPIRDGQPLMIQLADLLPIGGHVRWSCGSQYGIMFSKFLSLSLAQEISRIGKLSDAWIDEVRLAHMDVGMPLSFA